MNATARELDSYGLFTAAAVQDPYPCYRRMREREPVHWSEKAQAWYFTRYHDVYELQDRPDLSVDRIETLYSYLPRTNAARFSDIVEHYNRWLLYRDDNYHDRLKTLFLKAMTPKAVERLRPMMQRRVNIILDALDGLDSFDAYLDFAARLPTQVMLDLLGLPDSDENMLIEARRRQPGEDMISAMARAEVAGERLSDLEILAHLQYDGDGRRRHLPQRHRHVVVVAAAVSRSTCRAQGASGTHRCRRRGIPAVRRAHSTRHSHRSPRLQRRRQGYPQGPDPSHHDRGGKP